jgi:hypothetical protein
LSAVHPVVRTNPVTGWKSIFAGMYIFGIVFYPCWFVSKTYIPWKGVKPPEADQITPDIPNVPWRRITLTPSVAVGPFPKRINELSADESDELLKRFKKTITENHDLQVRFKWRNEHDIGKLPCVICAIGVNLTPV